MNSFTADIENRVHATPMKPIQRGELICISYLVFFSGIQMAEIAKLTVRDVIDQSGGVRNAVEKFEPQLPLNTQAKDAIARYYAEMKRRRPAQAMRRKPLFPSYQSQSTLRRCWRKVGTGYAEIHETGIKYHFASNRSASGSRGQLYKKGGELFRISDRQYQAVVHVKKIPPGPDQDTQCCDLLVSLIEKADHLRADSPTIKSDVMKILQEAEDTVDRIKNTEVKNEYRKLNLHLQEILSRHL